MNKDIDNVYGFTHCFRMIGDSMDCGDNRCFADGDILCCDELDIQSIEAGECYIITSQGGGNGDEGG